MSNRFLRNALLANGVFSFASGALAVFTADVLAAHLAFPSTPVSIIGCGLMVYGLALGALSRRERRIHVEAALASLLDFLWVLGSVIVLFVLNVPTPLLIAAPAVAVLVLALLQLEGLRRSIFADRVGTFSVSRIIHASATSAWKVVSDVAAYAEVAGTLHRSEVVSGQGLGMIRRCEDTSGVCWLETCARWDEGRGYSFEVDTSAPKYPLPLAKMRGDFDVVPLSETQCSVGIRFTFAARGGRAMETIVAVLFALKGGSIVDAILARWDEKIRDIESQAMAPKDSGSTMRHGEARVDRAAHGAG